MSDKPKIPSTDPQGKCTCFEILGVHYRGYSCRVHNPGHAPVDTPEPKFACLCLPVHNSKAEHDDPTPDSTTDR